MKNYFYCLMLLLLLPVVSCEAKSIAVFDETVYDFGTVKKESTISHTFTFKNAGTGTLVIERIKAG